MDIKYCVKQRYDEDGKVKLWTEKLLEGCKLGTKHIKAHKYKEIPGYDFYSDTFDTKSEALKFFLECRNFEKTVEPAILCRKRHHRYPNLDY